jgi:hyperosmotically inducible protein
MMPDRDTDRHAAHRGSGGGGQNNVPDRRGKVQRLADRDGRHATLVKDANDASMARHSRDARGARDGKDPAELIGTGTFGAAHIDAGNQGVPSTVRGAKGLSPDLVDDQLKEQLQNVLDSDPNLGAYALRADVVEREAQIQGVVDTLAEKEQAERLASRIPGIAKVDAAIAVSTDGPITDKGVEFEVSEELEAHPEVSTRNVGAKVEKGVVTLVGNADDPGEVQAAKEAASKARGVTEVHSRVKVHDKGDVGGREKNPRH